MVQCGLTLGCLGCFSACEDKVTVSKQDFSGYSFNIPSISILLNQEICSQYGMI